MNTLREALQEYLDLRRGLGFKMHDAGLLLSRFVSFMEQRQAVHITTRLALEWAQCPSVQPAEWARRLCFVRGFARHRRASDNRTEVPPVGLLPQRSTRAKPYLYTNEEVQRLLDAALELPVAWPSTPLRPWVFYCLIGLLSVTGLRISEALNLELGDVNIDDAVLTIRGTKHGRSRLVPIHASTCSVLADYLRRREEFFDRPVSSYVFVTRCGGARDYARWAPARGHDCTTFDTASPFRL
jgi:integrase/recombinase XerD